MSQRLRGLLHGTGVSRLNGHAHDPRADIQSPRRLHVSVSSMFAKSQLPKPNNATSVSLVYEHIIIEGVGTLDDPVLAAFACGE